MGQIIPDRESSRLNGGGHLKYFRRRTAGFKRAFDFISDILSNGVEFLVECCGLGLDCHSAQDLSGVIPKM